MKTKYINRYIDEQKTGSDQKQFGILDNQYIFLNNIGEKVPHSICTKYKMTKENNKHKRSKRMYS